MNKVQLLIFLFGLANLVSSDLLLDPTFLIPNMNSKLSALFPMGNHGAQSSDPSCRANSTSSSVPPCSLKLENLTTGQFVAGSMSRSNFLPKWINLTLAREGQKFGRDFRVSIVFGHIFGLISGFGVPELTNVLIFTEKSDTQEKTELRYMATAAQVLIWYDDMLEDKSDNVVLTSLQNVRIRHITSAQKAAERLKDNGTLIKPGICNVSVDNALWEDYENDITASSIPKRFREFSSSFLNQGEPIPINQFAQALTIFAFSGFITLYPERLAIDTNDEDLFAFNHLWAVIGYALGIDDKYNIQLQPDFKHLKEYYQQIMEKYWIAAFFNLYKYNCAKLLADTFLKAFSKMIPILTPRVLLMRLLTVVLDIEVPNLRAHMSSDDQVKETALDAQYLPMLRTPTTRSVVNDMANQYVEVIGSKYFGSNYSNEASKAEGAFYSMKDTNEI